MVITKTLAQCEMSILLQKKHVGLIWEKSGDRFVNEASIWMRPHKVQMTWNDIGDVKLRIYVHTTEYI